MIKNGKSLETFKAAIETYPWQYGSEIVWRPRHGEEGVFDAGVSSELCHGGNSATGLFVSYAPDHNGVWKMWVECTTRRCKDALENVYRNLDLPMVRAYDDAPEWAVGEAPRAYAGGWEPVDIAEILAKGSPAHPAPVRLTMSDGNCLLYAGKTHSFSGESESGKSWLGQLALVEAVNAGEPALCLDFEDDELAVVGRMLDLGADPEMLGKHFTYVRPESKPSGAGQDAFTRLLDTRYRTVVIDGVTAALSVFGLKGREEDDIARWHAVLPRPFADTGAAVVEIDHVTKSQDGRGRYAIGSQHKLNGITGAAYVVERVEPFGKKRRGESRILVAKDRCAHVRGNAGSPKASGLQEVARFELDATGDEIAYSLTAHHDILAVPLTPVERKIREMDEAGVPINATKEKVRDFGVYGRNHVLAEAIRIRRERHYGTSLGDYGGRTWD